MAERPTGTLIQFPAPATELEVTYGQAVAEVLLTVGVGLKDVAKELDRIAEHMSTAAAALAPNRPRAS